jgi:hypothetical protein
MSSDPKFQNTSLEGNPDTPLVHHRLATDTPRQHFRFNYPIPDISMRVRGNRSLNFWRIHQRDHNDDLTINNLVLFAELQVGTMLIVRQLGQGYLAPEVGREEGISFSDL